MQLNSPALDLILIGQRFPDWGGTAVHTVYDQISAVSPAPRLRLSIENHMNQAIYAGIQSGYIQHAHDISSGGLWVSLVEMILGERGYARAGVTLTLSELYSLSEWAFSESAGFIIAVPQEHSKSYLKTLKTQLGHAEVQHIGQTQEELELSICYQKHSVGSWSIKTLLNATNTQNQAYAGTPI